jgi:hypothetical protein
VSADVEAEEVVVVGLGAAGGGEGGDAWLVPRGMMVLFLKQVHLQKVGAAVTKLLVRVDFGTIGFGGTGTYTLILEIREGLEPEIVCVFVP